MLGGCVGGRVTTTRLHKLQCSIIATVKTATARLLETLKPTHSKPEHYSSLHIVTVISLAIHALDTVYVCGEARQDQTEIRRESIAEKVQK